MHAYEVVITPDAETDIREIRDYIVRVTGHRKIALGQIRSIRRAIDGLRAMPARFGLVDFEPWSSRGVRKCLAEKYLVYYRIDEQAGRVHILNVVFASRDQVQALSRQRSVT